MSLREILRRAAPGLRSARGQSVVELAVVLPVVLTVIGGGLDFGRAYERQVKLQHAVRQASERVAMTVTSQGSAASTARRLICVQMDLPPDCSEVSAAVTWSSSSTALGATTMFPMVSVSIDATLPFRTMFPYPFFSSESGDIRLRATSSYSVLQGR